MNNNHITHLSCQHCANYVNIIWAWYSVYVIENPTFNIPYMCESNQGTGLGGYENLIILLTKVV